MPANKKIEKYLEGKMTEEESKQVQKELAEQGELGNSLLVGAASYLLEDEKRIEELLGESDAKEFAALKSSLTSNDSRKTSIYTLDDVYSSKAAEEEESFKKKE